MSEEAPQPFPQDVVDSIYTQWAMRFGVAAQMTATEVISHYHEF